MRDNNNNKEKFDMQELQKLLMQVNGAPNKSAEEKPVTLTREQKIMAAREKMIKRIKGAIDKFVHLLDRSINFIVKTYDPDRNEIVQYARPPILFGTGVVFIFIMIGGLWAGTAPLDSASHAMGVVMANKNKQIVQYSGQGPAIVKEIFVKQGDSIKEGAPIVALDDTSAKSQYEAALNQYLDLVAAESRLIAERDQLGKIEFSQILFDFKGPEVLKIIHAQTNIFNSNREYLEKSKALYQNKIAQNDKLLISQIKTSEVTTLRLQNMRQLLSDGYASKASIEDLEAKEAEHIARIANIKQETEGHKIAILKTIEENTQRISKELSETQVRRASAKEKYIVCQDALDRIIIKSPVDGVVNQINNHTIGGLIMQNGFVAEVTPINDKLIIDAKIPVSNIDSVMVGQVAKIKFLAFKSRTSPMFLGKVVSISPDTIQDQQMAGSFAQHNKMMARAGDTFYSAKIEIDMDEFDRIANPRGLKLIPGMMADIQIVTGTRTLVRYLLDPVIDQAFKAFKER